MSKAKSTTAAGSRPTAKTTTTKPTSSAAAAGTKKAAAPARAAAAKGDDQLTPSRAARGRQPGAPAAAPEVAEAPKRPVASRRRAASADRVASTESAVVAAARADTAPPAKAATEDAAAEPVAVPVSRAAAGSVVADTFRSPDGVGLYYCVWRPEGPPKRQVILVHGFADHLGRYSYLVGSLVKNGAVVYAYDQRGAGRSEGKRGHVQHYKQLLDELDAFLRLAAEAEPGLPRILYAHSTGAILALTYLYEHTDAVDGVVLSAPCLRLTFEAPGWKTGLGKILSRVAPGFTMQAGFEPGAVSRDDKVVAENKADPLVTQAITTRFYTEVYLTAMPAALARIEELKTPFLLLQGTADRLVSPTVADEFEHRATAPGVIKRYEGGYHESHNDIHRQDVFHDVDDWLRGNTSPKSTAPEKATRAAATSAARKAGKK